MRQDVLGVFAPHWPGRVGEARREASAALALRGRYVLPLLDVVAEGSQVAWLYPFEPLIAVRHFVAAGLDVGAGLWITADVARTVADVAHVGPGLDHVLVDSAGTVRVAHFVGPLAPTAAYGQPRACPVFRLGCLLTELWGGAPPAATTLEAHGAALDALEARLRERCEGFDDRCAALLRALLAWDALDRPVIGDVPAQIARIAPPPTPTREGLAARFGGLLRTLRQPTWDRFDAPPVGGDAVGSERTLRDGELVVGDFRYEDEPTVESELGVSAPHLLPEREQGSLPLRVGPPPELARRRPRLPPGFLRDGGEATTESASTEPMAAPATGGVGALAVLGVALLVLAAALLGWGLAA